MSAAAHTPATEVRTPAAVSTASTAAVPTAAMSATAMSATAAAFPRRCVSGARKRGREKYHGDAETEFRHSPEF